MEIKLKIMSISGMLQRTFGIWRQVRAILVQADVIVYPKWEQIVFIKINCLFWSKINCLFHNDEFIRFLQMMVCGAVSIEIIFRSLLHQLVWLPHLWRDKTILRKSLIRNKIALWSGNEVFQTNSYMTWHSNAI